MDVVRFAYRLAEESLGRATFVDIDEVRLGFRA
jgi:hypothetical protein